MTKKRISDRWKRLRAKREDADITKQYTPGDYQILANGKGTGAGIIRPETGDLRRLSSLDAVGESQQTDSPSRVVLVIVMLALIFIAMITYFVMQMPQKD
ncbi:MAG: hypothetical protein WBV94_33460 [Blastocatellia bacterium]